MQYRDPLGPSLSLLRPRSEWPSGRGTPKQRDKFAPSHCFTEAQENIVASPLFYAHRHLIMERAAAAHLPTIYEWPESAEEGGFAAYGPRASQLYAKIMPQQIVKLFRGTKVADIPVEQATKFELVINLKTAKAMGVTVPEALLVRADKVIE